MGVADKTYEELAMNREVIAQQMTLIDEIHCVGNEVLMFSHVYKFILPKVLFRKIDGLISYPHLPTTECLPRPTCC